MDETEASRQLPCRIYNGLAIYRFVQKRAGATPRVLFMPGPHRFQNPSTPTAQSLIDGFVNQLGYEVISFDPPGSGNSTRPCRLGMQEMHDCANQVLLEISMPALVDVDSSRNEKVIGVGHSMGGLAILSFALNYPDKVDRLVLICTGSGGPAYMKAPGALWNQSHPAFYKLAILGILHILIPSLAFQKMLMNFINRYSYICPNNVPHDKIEWLDWFRWKKGHSSDWHPIARKLDYNERLSEIKIPTLVIGTRHDVQFPLACSQELHRNIPNSQLAIFEHSGHYPFVEEPIEFWEAVSNFLARCK